MDEKNNVGGYSDRNLNRRMLVGSRFFTRGDYADAAYCFRHARDASIQIYGESSLECAIARYSYGLCLLCQVSIPVNDPMHLVPKEVDYYDYEGSALPFPSSAFRRYTGAMEGKDVKMLEDAKGELILAWSLVEYRIDYYILKANILSALGEVAFRRGELNPQRYYFEALSVFDSLYGENNKRVADMYPSQTDPPFQQKKDEASQLVDIIAKLEIKASSYERRILYLYSLQDKSAKSPAFSFLKLDRLEAGTSLSFYREVTSVTQHRYSRRTVKVNTNLGL